MLLNNYFETLHVLFFSFTLKEANTHEIGYLLVSYFMNNALWNGRVQRCQET